MELWAQCLVCTQQGHSCFFLSSVRMRPFVDEMTGSRSTYIFLALADTYYSLIQPLFMNEQHPRPCHKRDDLHPTFTHMSWSFPSCAGKQTDNINTKHSWMQILSTSSSIHSPIFFNKHFEHLLYNQHYVQLGMLKLDNVW